METLFCLPECLASEINVKCFFSILIQLYVQTYLFNGPSFYYIVIDPESVWKDVLSFFSRR